MLFTLTLLLGANTPLVSCAAHNDHAASAQSTPIRYEYASIQMGSRCSIALYADSEPRAAAAAEHAFDTIAAIEDTLTDYRPNSEAMCATSQPSGQWVAISPILADVLNRSRSFYELSNGAFDPTVGGFTHLWRAAKREQRIPTAEELLAASESVGFHLIELDTEHQRVRSRKPGIILDFGAIGKGYAADKAIEVLRSHGISAALVDIGGDLAMGDPPPDRPDGWAISVQPGNSAEWSAPLRNAAIATSGDLERHYEFNGARYSHILDPRTGMGITAPRAVTVIARDATTADAAASIVSVLGEPAIEMLREHFPEIQIRIATGEPFAQSPPTNP